MSCHLWMGVGRRREFGEVSCTVCTAQGIEWFWIDSSGKNGAYRPGVKMETRHPVDGYFGSEFPEICNHCGVMTAWSRKTLKFFEKFCVFWEKPPFTVKFSKFFFRIFHRKTDRHVVFKFCEIWLMENWWNRALFIWPKNFLPCYPAFATVQIAPKIYQGQPPTMYSECFRFHPNWITSGGVIAKHVNTAKMRCKVNPMFGWSLASIPIYINKCTNIYSLQWSRPVFN